jgi:hypothetical protein
MPTKQQSGPGALAAYKEALISMVCQAEQEWHVSVKEEITNILGFVEYVTPQCTFFFVFRFL